MNKLTTQLVGATIGAAIGYLIADWYIETYIPEEEFELAEPYQVNKFNERLAKKRALPTANMNRAANGVPGIKNYTEFFRTENRPELAAEAIASGDIFEPLDINPDDYVYTD